MAATKTKVKINKQKTLTIPGSGENVEQLELSLIVSGNAQR